MDNEIISISDTKSRKPSTTFKSSVREANLQDSSRLEHQSQSTLCSDTTTHPHPYTNSTKQNSIKLTHFNKTNFQCPKTKVRAWLNQNYNSMINHVEFSPHQQFLTRNDSKGILLRRDYNKVVNNHANIVNKARESQKQLSIYREHSVNACIEGSSQSSSPTVHNAKEVAPAIKPTESLSNQEMQKKMEFYEYLRLMDKKPSGKLNLESVQNRRSSRVKNFVLLNKKGILAKEHHKDVDGPNIVELEKSKTSRSSCKEFSDSSNSKDSKKFSRRSLSVELSHSKSYVENIPKPSKTTNSYLQLHFNHETRVNMRTEAIRLQESLQVPEITSTSIASNNTNSQLLTCLQGNKQKLIANKIQHTVEKQYKLGEINYKTNRLELKSLSSRRSCLVKGSTSISSITMSSTSRKHSVNIISNTPNVSESPIKDKGQKRSILTEDFSHPKVPKLVKTVEVGIQKIMPIKSQLKIVSKKKQHFGNPQRLNRLRSSGKLKKLQLEAVIFKCKKRKALKKKLDFVVPQVLLKSSSKPFVKTDLIQPGLQVRSCNSNNDLKLYESDFLFMGLTPEHQLALVESKRFLDMDVQKCPSEEQDLGYCIGFTFNEVNMSASSFEKIQSVVDYMNERLNRQLQNITQYSSEDLEVSRLTAKLVVKNFARKVPTDSSGHTSDDKLSLTGEDLRCTSSYPQSSDSCVNIVNSEREMTIDLVSNTEVTNEPIELDEFVTTSTSPTDDDDDDDYNKQEVINISQIDPQQCECQELYIPAETATKSLNECLSKPLIKRKDLCTKQNCSDQKLSLSHTVSVLPENGEIIGAYYLNYNLIVVQKLMVSFWNQTPLGNVLGAQDMWLPKGCTSRLILEKGCVRKESAEVIISLLHSTAYIELWTTEHKSEKREQPLADIFVAIYLVLSPGGCRKKVLQLENIHGFANDVQYIVLRNSRNIIVSWNIMNENVSSTTIHCYELSEDYQTLQSIKAVQSVHHYISSLHNVEDCDNIIMGCGDQKVTLWNFENLDCCYVIATIDLINVPSFRTLWAKCDRGFLFTLHELNNGHIQLVAINSNASTWKRLRTYKNPEHVQNRLTGVCIESGFLIACYDTGLLSWNAQTSDLLSESFGTEKLFLTFGSNIIIVLNEQLYVRQALEHLIAIDAM